MNHDDYRRKVDPPDPSCREWNLISRNPNHPPCSRRLYCNCLENHSIQGKVTKYVNHCLKKNLLPPAENICKTSNE